MIDLEKYRMAITETAKKRNLSLVVLYGSQATGKSRENSDIDIAVLGKETLKFEDIADMNNDFSDIFGRNDLDVKSLHFANPLFRFQVMRDGRLLFGDRKDFLSFKAYAFRDFHDSWDLLQLKESIIKKRLIS
jgi:predicted nucleotidyltransferase